MKSGTISNFLMLVCHPSFVQLKVTLYIGSHRTRVSLFVLEQVLLLHDIQMHCYHTDPHCVITATKCWFKTTGSGKTLVALTNTLLCPSCKCDMCGWYSNTTYMNSRVFVTLHFSSCRHRTAVCGGKNLFYPCNMLRLDFIPQGVQILGHTFLVLGWSGS